MPSQLYDNDAITFIACKNFIYRGVPYERGDDFPQAEANNIETLVRSRFVIPVLEEGALKPRHWHREVRTREQAMEYINRDRVQLVMPTPPDSDEVVDIPVLTHPEQTPETPQESGADKGASPADAGGEVQSNPAEAVHSEEYDPSYHTVVEVRDYLASHPDEREQVLAKEREGRARKGLLEE